MSVSPIAERTLDESAVRSLVRQGAPHLADLALQRADEGWDNATWRLGDDLAVRVPRRRLAASLIGHEQRSLPVIGRLLDAVGVRTPVPLVDGQPTSEFPWPWSIVPWIPGAHALERRRSENGSWAPELARALLALHRPAPANAPRNAVRGIPLVNRDDRMRSFLAQIPTPIAEVLARAWVAGIAAPGSTERVWIHGDLHPGNIIIEDDHLSALIDFGDVTAGDPAYDLAVAWMAFDVEGRAAFRRSTATRYDDATWTRARAWAACVAAILITQSDDREVYLALGHATSEELMAEDIIGPSAP